MKSEFWHSRWKSNEIGFHESAPNENLVSYVNKLGLEQGSKWFLPLCGKTLDIAWLVSRGYKVIGVELSELAIEQLFDEMGITPKVKNIDDFKLFQADNIDIWVGDFFSISAEMLGEIDAVFDRGSLVALPIEMRAKYVPHLKLVTNTAPQLLVCYEYDQSLRAGPPFTIPQSEIEDHYAATHLCQLVKTNDARERMGVTFPMDEKVWLLIKSE